MRTAMALLMCLANVVVLAGSTRADESAATRYSGDLLERSTATGDWNGGRNNLAAKGVTVDARLTQIGQGVVDGGKSHTWEYGGRFNLTEILDTQKMGLWPGGFVTLELEGNWGDAVNGNTGALMPVNSSQLYPEPLGDNLNIPNLSYAQFLSHYFGVMAGKLDTLSNGDSNEFAHGKGDTQFFNLAFNINPLMAVTVPYSTLGVAAIVLPTQDPEAAIVTVSVLQANGKASDIGFDELSEDKLTFAGQGRMRTRLFGLTGHQLVGGAYSNRNYSSLDQRLGFVIENRRLAREDGSWAVYYNFDQFLHERAEERGVGIFGRFGASDGNPNLMQYFASIGFGGTGMIASRPNDRFGIGYYYLNIENPTFQTPLATRSFLQDEHGFEVFYNLAITPWMLLTPDLQVISGSQKERLGNRKNIDTATVLGFRMQLIF